MLNKIVGFLEILPYVFLVFVLIYNKRKYNKLVEYSSVPTRLYMMLCLVAIALYVFYH